LDHAVKHVEERAEQSELLTMIEALFSTLTNHIPFARNKGWWQQGRTFI
jgi:hypothetical protein